LLFHLGLRWFAVLVRGKPEITIGNKVNGFHVLLTEKFAGWPVSPFIGFLIFQQFEKQRNILIQSVRIKTGLYAGKS
jgi:hypothetical protein